MSKALQASMLAAGEQGPLTIYLSRKIYVSLILDRYTQFPPSFFPKGQS